MDIVVHCTGNALEFDAQCLQSVECLARKLLEI